MNRGTVPCSTQDIFPHWSSRNEALKSRLDILKRQYYEARLGYDIISNAFFWKITGPFRWTLDQLKKTLEGNAFAEGAWNALRWIYWRGNIPPAPGLPPADTDPVSEPGDSVTILCSLHTVFIARLIRHSLGLVSIRSDILTCEPAIYKSGLHIVVCPQMFRKLPEHYISFQMEQIPTKKNAWRGSSILSRMVTLTPWWKELLTGSLMRRRAKMQ